jgi:hypothetical protein
MNWSTEQELLPVLTPVELGIQPVKSSTQASKQDITLYQQKIGANKYYI